MDMTRDFINKIQEMDTPHEIDYEGLKFVDKSMSALPRTITAGSLETSTLTSIVDYIKSGTDSDSLDPNQAFVVHVADYNHVELYKELNKDKKRDNLISAIFGAPTFNYGDFISLERFIIGLQSMFVQDGNAETLLKFVGSVKNDSSAEQHDNGVSQTVTMKQGISLSTNAKVPNPVTLTPYRTFSEIDQPKSQFVFRVRKDDMQGVTAALFEADGGAWQHEAIQSIKEYLTGELKGQPVIILA